MSAACSAGVHCIRPPFLVSETDSTLFVNDPWLKQHSRKPAFMKEGCSKQPMMQKHLLKTHCLQTKTETHASWLAILMLFEKNTSCSRWGHHSLKTQTMHCSHGRKTLQAPTHLQPIPMLLQADPMPHVFLQQILDW